MNVHTHTVLPDGKLNYNWLQPDESETVARTLVGRTITGVTGDDDEIVLTLDDGRSVIAWGEWHNDDTAGVAISVEVKDAAIISAEVRKRAE